VFEEDVNVFKRFAFNEGELIFAYGKTICYFTWSEDAQQFEALEEVIVKDNIV